MQNISVKKRRAVTQQRAGLASALRHRLMAKIATAKCGTIFQSISPSKINNQHLRGIGALLLRISKPPGARQSGKLAQSKDMKRQILRAIHSKQNRETTSLFGTFVNTDEMMSSKVKGETDLIRLFPAGHD
ncbi:MAG: hypothetical protein WBF99_03530 [Xanthobacteraceae bacterium]